MKRLPIMRFVLSLCALLAFVAPGFAKDKELVLE